MNKKSRDNQNIGPYIIQKKIGKGGMGEVYLAYDPLCKRNVALKRILPKYSDNITIRSRFLREAKIASRLSHPSIIPIYTIHSDSSSLYYTMPFVEGKTLKEILQNIKRKEQKALPLSSEESIISLARIFLQVCEAIAYTHSQGILHRDLKPENILIGKFGEVVILDWGIANFLSKINENDEEESVGEILEEKSNLTSPEK